MDEQEKYNSPNFGVMEKWKIYVLILSPLVASVGVFTFMVRKTDLTFETQKQKYEVIHHLNDKGIHVDGNQKATTDYLQINQNRIEKRQEEVVENQKELRENQMKIGQDLQQIKRLIKKIDK